MIRPDQIPNEVVIAAREAWLRSDVNAQSDWQVAIAAALNAWPKMKRSRLGSDGDLRIILPLPIEEES